MGELATLPFNLEYEIPSYRLVEIYNHGETDTIILHKYTGKPIPLIMNDDFSIMVYMPISIAPNAILQDLEE